MSHNEHKISRTANAQMEASELRAENSCVNCLHERTCGYSPLAMLGRRTPNSYKACVLGLKSSGKPFFAPATGAYQEHLKEMREREEADS